MAFELKSNLHELPCVEERTHMVKVGEARDLYRRMMKIESAERRTFLVDATVFREVAQVLERYAIRLRERGRVLALKEERVERMVASAGPMSKKVMDTLTEKELEVLAEMRAKQDEK